MLSQGLKSSFFELMEQPILDIYELADLFNEVMQAQLKQLKRK